MALVDAFEWLKNPEHVITGDCDFEISIEWLKKHNVKEVLVEVDPDKDGYYEISSFVIRLPEKREDLVGMFVDLIQGPYTDADLDESDPELLRVDLY